MYVVFPDEALGALAASQAALEAVFGSRAADLMLCVVLLVEARNLGHLRLFGLFDISAVCTPDGRWTIDVVTNGVGLRLQPTDRHGRPMVQATELEESDVQQATVMQLLGVPVPVGGAGAR
ncbi:hypothetical protein ACQEVZ_27770 [Dactylosporangium sp. CA-152071]|uniref:hypothetical protein n=1 Tax=Dactylosporangium sp. CA-152071 TaxID=3239933 RepID=UPI003D9225B2